MPARAAFLDRDGTIVIERHYLADPDLVELVPGAALAMKLLGDAGFKLVIVTNQSGIARGLYSESDFEAVQRRLLDLLGAEGVRVDAVYHCPHHPELTGPCDCRKPGPGMYRWAARDLGVDVQASAYVGDRMKDVEPARVFGGMGILVRTGHGADEAELAPEGTLIVSDLRAAADEILRANHGL